MKNISKLIPVVLVLAIAIFSSCSKEETEPATETAKKASISGIVHMNYVDTNSTKELAPVGTVIARVTIKTMDANGNSKDLIKNYSSDINTKGEYSLSVTLNPEATNVELTATDVEYDVITKNPATGKDSTYRKVWSPSFGASLPLNLSDKDIKIIDFDYQ